MSEEQQRTCSAVICSTKKKIDAKRVLTECIPIAVTGVLLLVFGIVYKQDLIKLLPTLISLVVVLLTARVNRFGLLLAGLNSALYSVGFFMESLYPSAVSALAISCPISIAGFILWSKNQTEKKQVKMRKLNAKSGTLFAVCSILCWVGCYFVYKALGTKSLLLDNTLFVLGIVIGVMQMLRYIEAPFFNIISLLVGITQWTILTIENIANINYLIYNIYSLYCGLLAVFNWMKLYRSQREENKTCMVQEKVA